MQKRRQQLGAEIAPLMFGGNVFGWTADEAMSFKLLDGFVDAGLDAIDTADVYSRWAPGNKGGESDVLGVAQGPRRPDRSSSPQGRQRDGADKGCRRRTSSGRSRSP
jgi:aryl-alcohol dehydrogenase-like predicted oxidoreductase